MLQITIYLELHIEDIIKKKTNRALIILNNIKQRNLDFFNDEKEDFSYSGL